MLGKRPHCCCCSGLRNRRNRGENIMGLWYVLRSSNWLGCSGTFRWLISGVQPTAGQLRGVNWENQRIRTCRNNLARCWWPSNCKPRR
ncbi:hypothetical protein CPC08DRAFT_118557 [Agrocybe pediades]|nr:hypothetical protein CPC08DRAFT_118557 [Agrocybe pediades]